MIVKKISNILFNNNNSNTDIVYLDKTCCFNRVLIAIGILAQKNNNVPILKSMILYIIGIIVNKIPNNTNKNPRNDKLLYL